MLDAPSRELIEIIRTLSSNKEKVTKQRIRDNITGFRDSDYVAIRLRKLVNNGYIERVNGSYRVIEVPQFTVDEITSIDEREFRVAASQSDIIYLILGFVKHRSEDLPTLIKEIKAIVPEEEVKQRFLEINTIYRLLQNPFLLPRIDLPNKFVEFDKVAEDIRSLFQERETGNER